jgi:hypothetical protein
MQFIQFSILGTMSAFKVRFIVMQYVKTYCFESLISHTVQL